jgi:hypothetical protein
LCCGLPFPQFSSPPDALWHPVCWMQNARPVGPVECLPECLCVEKASAWHLSLSLFVSLPFCSFLLVSLRFSCHFMSPVFSWRLSLLTPLVASLSRSNSSQNRMDDAVHSHSQSWKKHHRYQGHALDMVLVLSSYQVPHNLTTQNSKWSNWVSYICFYIFY